MWSNLRPLTQRELDSLRALGSTFPGYKVSRLEHSLQSATRAYRDGRSEEYVAAALLHDIGDNLAPYTHGEMVAAILKPFLPEKLVWIVKYHGLFQMYYYAHYYGGDRDARERFRDHPWFDDCAEFCEKYDQNCFDPQYDSLPLEFFEPLVRKIFSAEPSFD